MSPLELKLTVMMEQAQNEEKKVDFEKENQCPLCFCPLFDGLFDKMTMDEVVQAQTAIIKQKNHFTGAKDDEVIGVVKLGRCQGMHFYHKECLEG